MPNIWIVDNRSRGDSLKASMTDRLITVLAEWYPDDTRVVRDVCDASRVQGGVVVLSGSSLSVTDMLLPQHAVVAVARALRQRMSILGICFGFQMLAWLHGIPVRPLAQKVRQHRMVDSVGRVYFHHGDGVFPGASVDEQHATCVHFDGACVCGVQFHPEATEAGRTWLRQWIANALGGHSKNKLKLANTF
jgi:GMP synthase-like glutamine amidotransferase